MPTTPRKPLPAPRRAQPAAPAKQPAATAARRVAKAPAPAVAPIVAVPPKASKVVKAVKVDKPRLKLVRDGFTMPAADFALIDILKARAVEARRPAKKSELLRAGLQALAALPPARLVAALDALAPVKTGRPKKGH